MPLLTTINDYFRENLPILIDVDSSEKSSLDASLDWYGLIHIHEERFFPGAQDFYKGLLHEFIHLDKYKQGGSVYGFGRPRVGEGISRELEQKLENEVDLECEEHIAQNSLVFRFLKEKLKSTNFIVEENH